MTRQEAIAHIENSFPADSPFDQISRIGRQLLEQAQREARDWRKESTDVLIRYAELCAIFEESQSQVDQEPSSDVFWFSRA